MIFGDVQCASVTRTKELFGYFPNYCATRQSPPVSQTNFQDLVHASDHVDGCAVLQLVAFPAFSARSEAFFGI